MKSLLVRREKSSAVRLALISRGIQFYEERDNFHYLFIFPNLRESIELEGKWCYLTGPDTEEIEIRGETFKIEGPRALIDLFAPLFERRGLKVKLEGCDNKIKIRRWGTKFLVSVS